MSALTAFKRTARLWTGWWEIGDLPTFFRTRREVLLQEASFALDPNEREGRALQDPWVFHLQKTLFAALPGAVVVGALDWLLSPPDSAVRSVADLYVQIEPQVTATLTAFVMPLTLLSTAPVAAWASLRAGDRTSGSIKKATEAYLYVDGAAGFVALAVLSLWASVEQWLDGSGLTARGVWGVPLLLLSLWALWAVGRLVWVTFRRVPKALYSVNGYGVAIGPGAAPGPPHTQYVLAGVIGTGLMAVAILSLTLLASQGVARLLAALRMWAITAVA